MARQILCAGRRITIEFAVRSNGTMPAKDFYEHDLSEEERTKLKPPFARLADDGYVANKERFKKVEGTKEMWEFKLHQGRRRSLNTAGGPFIVTQGLEKKEIMVQKGEVVPAEKIRAEHK